MARIFEANFLSGEDCHVEAWNSCYSCKITIVDEKVLEKMSWNQVPVCWGLIYSNCISARLIEVFDVIFGN